MTLTPQQINDFQTNGFLLLPKFADPQRCDAILELAKKYLAEKSEPLESEEEYLQQNSSKKTVRRLRQVYDRDPLFAEWMTEPEIRPVLEQLLGEEPRLLLAHHNSIMTKLPHVSSVTSWHQDIRYWHYENDNLLSVWLSLGDEYLENGLLEFIPGSHKMKFAPEQFDAQSGFREDLPQNRAIIAKRVHFDLKKGDVVLFHAKTLHYARKNNTDTPKISFVYSVRACSNKPIPNTRSDYREVVL
ncbi:phytanoyl-CoA dioxygenase family protein [Sulfurimonas sp. HSL3-7]|uniref:phytanoyl-CoA dioxygenase family protein n=1 Tax=Sulfonitrofixus jiaomeiensis TaxID=3131938 RepID=UPI0031F8C4F7